MKTYAETVRMVKGWKTTVAKRPADSNGRRQLLVLDSGIDDVLAALEGPRLELTDEQNLRIRQAVGAMPYGGLASMRPVRDLDELLDWLDSMRGVLADVAERSNRAEEELRALQRQRDAVRTFFGLDEADA